MSKLEEDLIEGMTEAVAHATRFFGETVRARAQRDPEFRDALLTEGKDASAAGDTATGGSVLRDFVGVEPPANPPKK